MAGHAGHPDFIIKKNRTAYSNQPFYKKRGYTSGTSHSQQPGNRRTTGQSMTQIVKKDTLYLGEHDLGNGAYAIEIICSTKE